MKMTPYNYLFLRYRHDVLSGEFFNIGLLYYSKVDNFLKFKVHDNYNRIKKSFSDADINFIKKQLTSINKKSENIKVTVDLLTDYSILSYAEKLLAKDDSSFIWSEKLFGVSPNHDAMFDDLFSRFITQYDDHETLKSQMRKDDEAIWKPFRDKLTERNIAKFFKPTVIKSKNNKVEFDHAWKNGEWHCIRPLSFDLANSDNMREKAAKWVGQLYGLSESSEKFQAYFLVGKPSNMKLQKDYQEVLNFLESAPTKPIIVDESGFDQFVDRLEDKIKAHEC